MLQAASPALQSGASPLCFAAAAWDARPSRSLNCPPPPPAQPCSGDDLAGFGGSPDGSNRTLTTNSASWALQNLCKRCNLSMLVAGQPGKKRSQAFIRAEQRQELLCLRSKAEGAIS